MAEAEDDGGGGADGDVLSFTLHLDKSLSCAVKIAAWNPEKDLLAMVTQDHQLLVHRFNWQRLWAVSPDQRITAICWRPDGKALAVGHHDGSIAIRDVENGDVLRQTATHNATVECLYWTEEGHHLPGQLDDVFSYEDRTPRFFPSPPRAPPMPGTAPTFDMSGVLGPGNEDQGSANQKTILLAVQQRLYVLCSGDKDGTICLSAFGVFPIGKLDIRERAISCMRSTSKSEMNPVYRLLNASALQVFLSNNLRNMTVICSGTLSMEGSPMVAGAAKRSSGLYAISVDTSLLGDRRKELRQVALQASSVVELLDVVQATLNVMHKQWHEAISVFEEKFQPLSVLLIEHGTQIKPRDELLNLLACGSASPGLHQFLASLGEAGLKRLAKSIDTAGRELLGLIAQHLQPAAEMIAFRIGELQGLSRWRARVHRVGLHETLMERAMEHAGMLLVQVECLLRTISDTAGEFRLFFVWLTKSLRQLSNDVVPSSNQLPVINSVKVAAFLRSHFEKDPISPHLAPLSDIFIPDVNLGKDRMMEELMLMGGFSDWKCLQRTFFQQIAELQISCEEAFALPVKEISPNLRVQGMLPLCPLPHLLQPLARIPLSLTYFEENVGPSTKEASPVEDYICLNITDEQNSTHQSVVVVLRRFSACHEPSKRDMEAPEVIALQIDQSLQCIDLALYKERQLVLLVRKEAQESGKLPQTYLMLLHLEDLGFMPFLQTISTLQHQSLLHVCSALGAVLPIGLKDGKVRAVSLPDAVPPLAVSASRGLACIFGGQRRVLLYDLEEDEEGKDDEII